MDYYDAFALVVRHNKIRILIALVAKKEWKIYQLDVKLTFLNYYLEEKVYVN